MGDKNPARQRQTPEATRQDREQRRITQVSPVLLVPAPFSTVLTLTQVWRGGTKKGAVEKGGGREGGAEEGGGEGVGEKGGRVSPHQPGAG